MFTYVLDPGLCAADVVLGRIEGIINSSASTGRFYKTGSGNLSRYEFIPLETVCYDLIKHKCFMITSLAG